MGALSCSALRTAASKSSSSERTASASTGRRTVWVTRSAVGAVLPSVAPGLVGAAAGRTGQGVPRTRGRSAPRPCGAAGRAGGAPRPARGQPAAVRGWWRGPVPAGVWRRGPGRGPGGLRLGCCRVFCRGVGVGVNVDLGIGLASGLVHVRCQGRHSGRIHRQQQRGREPDGAGDPAARCTAEGDPDARAPGEVSDHEQAEDLGGYEVEPFPADQPGVLLVEPFRAHAEAVVDDLDQRATVRGDVGAGPDDHFDGVSDGENETAFSSSSASIRVRSSVMSGATVTSVSDRRDTRWYPSI